jgi:hypothetical protein
MPHIENRANVQMRVTLNKKSSWEIVCLESSRKPRLSAFDLVRDGSNRAGGGSFDGLKTHGSAVTFVAVCFTMLSPLIGLIIAYLGAWFFDRSSF